MSRTTTMLERVRAAVQAGPAQMVLGDDPLRSAAIGQLVSKYLGGGPVPLRRPTLAADDPGGPASVVIHTTAPVLGGEADITLRVTSDADGALVPSITVHPAAAWRMSQAFPDLVGAPLPGAGHNTFDASTAAWRAAALADAASTGVGSGLTPPITLKPLWDRMQDLGALVDVSLTAPAQEPGVATLLGWDLAATVRPVRLTGLARRLVGDVSVSGAVVPWPTGPAASDPSLLPPSDPTADPLDGTAPDGSAATPGGAVRPGITARGNLPPDAALAGLPVRDGQLRMRSMARRPATTPAASASSRSAVSTSPAAAGEPGPGVLGVAGSIGLGGAASIPVTVVLPLDDDGAVVARARPGIGLPGLGALEGLGGSADLTAPLPPDLAGPLGTLASVTLDEVLFSLRDADDDLTVDRMALTVSTGQKWTVLPDVVDLEEVKVTLDALTPFPKGEAKRRVEALVTGRLTLGGVGADVVARLTPTSKVVTARLRHGEVVQLGALLADLLPDVPLPADLEVTAFELTASLAPAPVLFVVASLTDTDDLAITIGRHAVKATDLSFQVVMAGGEVTGQLTGRFSIAGADLSLTAARPQPNGGWEFRLHQEAGDALPLGQLLADLLGDGVVLPSPLAGATVAGLHGWWDLATDSGSFGGRLTAPLDLDLGSTKTSVTLGLEVSSIPHPTEGRQSRARLTGVIDLGDLAFTVEIALGPKEATLKASAEGLDALGYDELARALAIEPPALDVDVAELGIDLSLSSVGFELDLGAAGGQGLLLRVTSTTLGDGFVVVRRDPAGRWGLALGLTLPPDGLASLPGELGEALAGIDILPVRQGALILSSTDYPGLDIPGVPVLSGAPVDLRAGLALALTVDLAGDDAETDAAKKASHLRRIAGRDTLVLQLAVRRPLIGSMLEAALGDVTIGPDDAPLHLKRSSLFVALGEGAFGVAGTITFDVEGQLIEATGRLAVDVNSFSAALSVRSDGVLFTPPGLKGVHFTELGGMLDLVIAPPSVGIGLAGAFVLGHPPALPVGGSLVLPAPVGLGPSSLSQRPAANRFAFAFAATGTAVTPRLLSLYLDEVSFSGLCVALLDEDPQLPDVFENVKVTELLLYWCREAMLLPDGTWAQPGVGFNANLDLWGFQAHANLMVDRARGVTGMACMDPMHIDGVLDITGTGPGTPDGYAGRRGVAPGGAYVHVSTLSSPYFKLSWHIKLLSTLEQDLEVEVTSTGFHFELDTTVGSPDAAPLFASTLECWLEDLSHFHAGFKLDLDLDLDLEQLLGLPLGKLHVVSAGADVQFDVQVGDLVAITLDARFEYEGQAVVMPQLALAVAPASVAELPELVGDAIADAAGELFDFVLDGLKEAGQWAKAVAEGLVEGVEDVTVALRDVFECSAPEAVEALKQADWAANEAAKALDEVYEAGSVVVNDLLAGAGYATQEIADAMSEVFDWGPALMDAAGLITGEVTNTVESFLGLEQEDVQLVVFNHTAHTLRRSGLRGGEISEGPDIEVPPGSAGVVAVFRAGGHRWEWVYLDDVTNGQRYQLYIQLTGSGSRYSQFGYYNADSSADYSNPSPFPEGTATASWTGGPTAVYTLLTAPT